MQTIYLTIPGVTNSDENHWQSIWEKDFPDKFRRIEQTEWHTPTCKDWIETIEAAVQKESPENVVLVAHSLGCIAVAFWARKFGTKIKGAFLVAPSDSEADSFTFKTKRFSPIPLDKLPFPSLVIASDNDFYVSSKRAKQLARAWGSKLINIGAKGHINGDAGFGKWVDGLKLLNKLDRMIVDKKALKKEYKQTIRPMGVYQIRNLINGKIFIGSSINLEGIINRYKFQLKLGSHPNRILQKDWDEFVEEDFNFEILEELEQRDGLDYPKELEFLEDLWIEKLQPFGKNGYNLKKKSREERLRMIAANRKDAQ